MTGQSPVVSSVGAVPVEVPEPGIGLIDELATALMDQWAESEPEHSITKHPVSYVATFVEMARAAYLLIAARVRAERDAHWQQRLADMQAEIVKIMEAQERRIARVRAEERQRIDGLIAARLAAPVGTTEYGVSALIALRADIAAGSAVPVAGDVAIRVADKAAELATVSRVSYSEAHATLMAACGFVPAVPVATPPGLCEHHRSGSHDGCAGPTTCAHGQKGPHSVYDRMQGERVACPGPVATPPSEFERMLADPQSLAWHKEYGSPQVKQAICVLEESGILPVPVATPTELANAEMAPVEDWPPVCPACRAPAPNLQVTDGPMCDHWFHRPPAEQDGQR